MDIPSYVMGLQAGGGSGGSTSWGDITGNIANQTDLKTELDSKVSSSAISDMATKTWVGNQGYLTEHQSLDGKQDKLVSGTNIKTINGESVLGSGDITISGEPNEYIKSANVDGNKLTLTKKDGTTQEFEYTAGSGITISNRTISIDSNSTIAVYDERTLDANEWLTNGYTKTKNENEESGATANLPSVCTGADRWGVLFYAAENNSNHAGLQQYFPIDGTYKGRIFYRSVTGYGPEIEPEFGDWKLVPWSDEIYTKDEIDSKVNAKQDIISDLSDIRSGASLGATSVQPSALESFYNKTEVDTKLSTKADVSSTYTKDEVDTKVNEKSTVTASSTGTSTNTVNYITIDDTEYKLPTGGSGSGATEDTFVFNNDLWTMYSIGKITASQTNPVQLETAGKTFKQVWNMIFVNELQPEIIENISWSFDIYNNSNVDCEGAEITPVAYVTLNPGKYTQYSGQVDTGVIIDQIVSPQCTVEKITDLKYKITLPTGIVPSTYSETRTYSNTQGVIAKTNIGNDSNPIVRIQAGDTSDTTSVSYTSTGATALNIIKPSLTNGTITTNAIKASSIDTEENDSNSEDFVYKDVTGAVVSGDELKFALNYSTPTGIYPYGYVGNPGTNISAECTISKQENKDMKLINNGTTTYVDLTNNSYQGSISGISTATITTSAQTYNYSGTVNYISGTPDVVPLSPKGNRVPGYAIINGDTTKSGTVSLESDGEITQITPTGTIGITSPSGTYEVGTNINVDYTLTNDNGFYQETHTGKSTRKVSANCPITSTTFTIDDILQTSGSYSAHIKDSTQSLNCKYEIVYGDGDTPSTSPVSWTSHQVPSKQIVGNTSAPTKTLTIPAGYRNLFYGYSSATSVSDLTSEIIRALTSKKNGANTLTLEKDSTQHNSVVVAAPAGTRTLSSVIQTSSMGVDVTKSFIKTASAIQVSGATISEDLIDYDIWFFHPELPIENLKYDITLS